MFSNEQIKEMAYNGFYTSLVAQFLEERCQDELKDFQEEARRLVDEYDFRTLQSYVLGYASFQLKERSNMSFMQWIKKQYEIWIKEELEES